MSSELVWLVVGGIALYYLSSSGLIGSTAAPLVLGPTVYADPVTSVQAGGQGYTVQSLRTLSMFGPYSTVG